MSNRGRYGVAIGIVTALMPLVTAVVGYLLERRRIRYQDDFDGEPDDRVSATTLSNGQ